MRETLNQIDHLLEEARKARKRGNTEKAKGLVADIRDLASSLAPVETVRCWCCGFKPNPRLSNMHEK